MVIINLWFGKILLYMYNVYEYAIMYICYLFEQLGPNQTVTCISENLKGSKHEKREYWSSITCIYGWDRTLL